MPEATTGPIQSPIFGFLGLLQLKNLGQNPRDLGNMVQPTMEMLQWYLQPQAIALSSQGTAAIGSGTTGQVISSAPNDRVPGREWWYVHNVLATVSGLAAGDTLGLAVCSIKDFITGGIPTIHGDVFRQPVSGVTTRPAAFARDFWLSPGTGLGAWITEADIAGSNISLHMRFTITRLPI